ncbi:hypothetical protein [Thalassotalea crassostreae]|uniref:hypothetical protein n=1 Tax=Thalassotalea crassostreae TaxID=1763536 RepID=UPI0008397102|nr:hypothetical protein [Thalassotalea crassostreae]
MNKNLIAAALIPFILTLTGCGGSDSESDPFEMLSGSWQKMSGDSLTEHYLYIDDVGNKTFLAYDIYGGGCYTKSEGIYPFTRHVEGNRFVAYGISGNDSNIYYTVSDDGNYLDKGPKFPITYLKSYLTITYFDNLLCE